MSATGQRITRDQIEAKFRELTGEVTDEVQAARSPLLAVGLAAVVLALAAAFLVGRRAGRRKSTVVEVRRL